MFSAAEIALLTVSLSTKEKHAEEGDGGEGGVDSTDGSRGRVILDKGTDLALVASFSSVTLTPELLLFCIARCVELSEFVFEGAQGEAVTGSAITISNGERGKRSHVPPLGFFARKISTIYIPGVNLTSAT